MKTPSEGWSEVGSDTTKEIYEETTPIMFHELSKAAEHTEDFTRYLEVLLKNNTNTNTNPKNTASPEGEYAEKIEGLHRKYSQLVNDLQRLLHVTQQEPLLEHVSSTRISPLTSQRTNQATYSDSLRDRLGKHSSATSVQGWKLKILQDWLGIGHGDTLSATPL
jgi:hypothetical protein